MIYYCNFPFLIILTFHKFNLCHAVQFSVTITLSTVSCLNFFFLIYLYYCYAYKIFLVLFFLAIYSEGNCSPHVIHRFIGLGTVFPGIPYCHRHHHYSWLCCDGESLYTYAVSLSWYLLTFPFNVTEYKMLYLSSIVNNRISLKRKNNLLSWETF